MSKERVQIDLYSSFYAGGFKAANNEVKAFGAKAENVFKMVAASCSELGGVASDTVNVFKEFAKGGIWAVAARGLGLLVDKCVEWYKESKQAFEEHKKLMDAINTGYQKRVDAYRAANYAELKDELADSVDKAKKLAASFDAARESAEKMARAVGGLKAATESVDLEKAKLDIEQRAMSASSKQEAALIRAKGNLSIQGGLGDIAIENAEKASSVAKNDAYLARKKAQAVEEEEKALRESIMRLRTAGAGTVFTAAEEAKRDKDVADLQKKLADATVRREKAVREAELADVAHKTAVQNEDAVRVRVQREYVQQVDALARLEEEQEKERKATEELERRKRDDARRKDAERAARAVTEKGEDEIRELRKTIEKANDLIEDSNKIQDRVEAGMASDADHHGGPGGGGYKYRSMRPDGTLDDPAEIMRAERYAQRGDRDQSERRMGPNAERRAQDRYDDLVDKITKGKDLSKDDAAFMDAWEKRQKQRRANDAAKDKDAAEKKIEKLRQQMADDVAEIKKKLVESLEVK